MTTISLTQFCKDYSKPKSSASDYLNKTLGLNISEGLDEEAQGALLRWWGIEAPAKDLQSAPEPSSADIEDAGGELSFPVEMELLDDIPEAEGGQMEGMQPLKFNPAELIGMTNGTRHTLAALEQVTEIAKRLEVGVGLMSQQAQAEYLQVSKAAKGAVDQLASLRLTLTEARATTTVFDALKQERVASGLKAQAEIEGMTAQEEAPTPKQPGSGQGGGA